MFSYTKFLKDGEWYDRKEHIEFINKEINRNKMNINKFGDDYFDININNLYNYLNTNIKKFKKEKIVMIACCGSIIDNLHIYDEDNNQKYDFYVIYNNTPKMDIFKESKIKNYKVIKKYTPYGDVKVIALTDFLLKLGNFDEEMLNILCANVCYNDKLKIYTSLRLNKIINNRMAVNLPFINMNLFHYIFQYNNNFSQTIYDKCIYNLDEFNKLYNNEDTNLKYTYCKQNLHNFIRYYLKLYDLQNDDINYYKIKKHEQHLEKLKEILHMSKLYPLHIPELDSEYIDEIKNNCEKMKQNVQQKGEQLKKINKSDYLHYAKRVKAFHKEINIEYRRYLLKQNNFIN